MISKHNYEVIKKDNFLTSISDSLRSSINLNKDSQDAITEIFSGEVFQTSNNNTKKKLDHLEKYVRKLIKSSEGLRVFYVLCKYCAPLINDAVNKVPNTEIMEEAKKEAINQLKIHGKNAIENIINDWDDFTYNQCMVEENNISHELFRNLKSDIKNSDLQLNIQLQEGLITGSLQEFERRTGQKRKKRAGDDLEEAVKVILEHIGLNLDPVPQHITGILEADSAIYHGGQRHGTMCLISCKRTGRERVRQNSVELQELQRLKISKIIWFFTDFDQSPQRVLDLGLRGSVFYLPDSSPEYKSMSTNPAIKKYIFPISNIDNSIRLILSGTL